MMKIENEMRTSQRLAASVEEVKEEPNPFPRGKGDRIKKRTGRRKIYSILIAIQIRGTTTRMPVISAVVIAPVERLDAALKYPAA
jgi:hypothetical protein